MRAICQSSHRLDAEHFRTLRLFCAVNAPSEEIPIGVPGAAQVQVLRALISRTDVRGRTDPAAGGPGAHQVRSSLLHPRTHAKNTFAWD